MVVFDLVRRGRDQMCIGERKCETERERKMEETDDGGCLVLHVSEDWQENSVVLQGGRGRKRERESERGIKRGEKLHRNLYLFVYPR